MIRSIDQAKAVKVFIIGTFVTLYLLVSIISTIHVIDFFRMSNPNWLAVSLAVAFEVGAAASLASIIALNKMNKGIVWMLFIILTLMQAMGNTYYAYTHLKDFQGWIELFGLNEEELIYQKRILSLVSGAILPVVALGFIKSLVDYIKPASEEEQAEEITEEMEQETEDDPTAPWNLRTENDRETVPAEAAKEPKKPVKKEVESSVPEFDPFKSGPTLSQATPTEKVNSGTQIDNLTSKRPNPDQALAKNGKA